MRLSQEIEKLPDDALFCIGSKTGFVFMGTKEEYARDIDGIEKHFLTTFNDELKEAEYCIETAKKGIAYENEDLIIYADKLVKIGQQLKVKVTAYDRVKSALENFLPFSQRKVIDSYQRMTENMTAFKVRGIENGSFWTRNEYVKARAKELYYNPERYVDKDEN